MKIISCVASASLAVLLLPLAPLARAQDLPQDLVPISLTDGLALDLGRLYRFSSFPDYPPLPPAVLLTEPVVEEEGSGGTNHLFYSPSWRGLFLDDRETLVLETAALAALGGDSQMLQEEDQPEDLGPQGPYGATDFYLEPLSVASNLFSAILHGTTNGAYYLISSTEALDPATNSVWLVEGTLQGGTNDATPFSLGIAWRTNNVFIRAEPCDEGCAATHLPLAWQLENFGITGAPASGDWDNDSVDNLTEYLNGTDPNKIIGGPRFTNYHINATAARGTFNLYRGVPFQMAILVNSDDLGSAQWLPYTLTSPWRLAQPMASIKSALDSAA